MSVSICQICVLSKLLNYLSGWFLAQELPSTHPTLAWRRRAGENDKERVRRRLRWCVRRRRGAAARRRAVGWVGRWRPSCSALSRPVRARSETTRRSRLASSAAEPSPTRAVPARSAPQCRLCGGGGHSYAFISTTVDKTLKGKGGGVERKRREVQGKENQRLYAMWKVVAVRRKAQRRDEYYRILRAIKSIVVVYMPQNEKFSLYLTCAQY